MKKWFVISLIFNLLIIISITYIALSWRGYISSFVNDFNKVLYEQRNTMFEAMPVHDSSIVFLGNSITQGANWAELFDNPRIINRGISGDVTEGILGRINEIVRHRPSKLFISIGTNDIGMEIPNKVIIENYQEIIKKVRSASPNTEIYVQSILPVANKELPSNPLLQLVRKLPQGPSGRGVYGLSER